MAYLDLQYERDAATGQIVWDASGNPTYATNAGANTYQQLQARIANEVLGSPTTSDIQNAISDAIRQYEAETFYFNSLRLGNASGSTELATVNGKEFYSGDDFPGLMNFPHISKIVVFAFNNRYPLISRTSSWIDDQSISTEWQGLPTDYCIEDTGAIRLFPVPNGAYPLILEGTIRFPALVNDTDYSPWTNRAERLIRLEAKRLLFTDIIRDAGQAAAMAAEIPGTPLGLWGNPAYPRGGALSRLRRGTPRRQRGGGKLRANRGYF